MINKNYILSQYANSPVLMSLLNGFGEMISVQNDITSFYNNIYNISTANTYGLNVWGIILNIPREFKTDEGIYYLSDNIYRLLLFCKAMANVSNCTIPNLLLILNKLFQNIGNIYIFDTGIMTMKYVFDFYLQPFEKAILMYQNVLPKPTGVGIDILELPRQKIFGFNGTGYMPFNQAPFRSDG